MTTPTGWLEVALGDVVEIRSGYGFPKALQGRSRGDYPFAKVRDISAAVLVGENVLYSTAHWVDKTDLPRLKARPLPAGSTLLAKIGEAIRLNRRVLAGRDLLVDNNVFALVPRGLEERFLLYFMRTVDLYPLAIATSVPSLRKSDLGELRLPLAPFNEQRRIVEKIEALMERSRRAKEALDAIPPLLERFRQSVLAAAFRGDLTAGWRAQNPDVEPAEQLLERIRAERRRRWEEDYLAKQRAKGKEPKNDKWKTKYEEPERVDHRSVPPLPDGWCWARWSEVGFCQNGRAFPSKLYCDDGIKLLRPGNLHVSGEVRWPPEATRFLPTECAERHPGHIVRGGELIMNLTAQSLKDEFLGRVCMTPPGDVCLLNQRLARLTPVGISVRFAFWLYKSMIFRRYVNEGLNSGSLIQHMFTKQVDAFVFPLPPLAEQEALVSLLDDVEARRGLLMEQHEAAEESHSMLEPSILAKAFRGELVAQHPDDEPASALLARTRAEHQESKPKRRSARGRRSSVS